MMKTSVFWAFATALLSLGFCPTHAANILTNHPIVGSVSVHARANAKDRIVDGVADGSQAGEWRTDAIGNAAVIDLMGEAAITEIALLNSDNTPWHDRYTTSYSIDVADVGIRDEAGRLRRRDAIRIGQLCGNKFVVLLLEMPRQTRHDNW